VKLVRGTIALFDIDRADSRGKRGQHPCVILSGSDVNSDQRFPLVCIAPLTATPGEGILYPSVSPGKNGLTHASYVLIDQLCSVDKRRVSRVFGRLAFSELAEIDKALSVFLGMGGRGELTSDA
jgi:mRNA-degrading endonuclease toxin of MazEF toxin-antitoxin module